MRPIGARPPQPQRATQRGQALLVIAAILVIGFSAAFYALFSPGNVAIERATITTAAPAQAREALIGYAASDNNHPGSLPAAGENTASNYLEGENADGNNSTFTTRAGSTTFNDRLLALTNGELMPAVERRVAREMTSILRQYKAATATSSLASYRPGIGVYPWADRDPAELTVVPNVGEPRISLKIGEIYERSSGKVRDGLNGGVITVGKQPPKIEPATKRGAAAKSAAPAR